MELYPLPALSTLIAGFYTFMNPKPELIPVGTPWKISSTSEISVSIYESGNITLHPTVSFIESDDTKITGYSIIEYAIDVVFFDTNWLKISPVNDDHADFYKEYNHDAVAMVGNSSLEALKQYRLKWLESELCPDPKMYNVKGSNWNPSGFLAERGYKHYIVLGRDIYIDIFGNKWEWQNKRRVIYR